MTGAITFLVAIPCALTGYVSQQNFDAQWISTQAKDAMNSVGIGAFFNLTNFGQMYSYHVLLLPVAVVALVIAHVLLVRTARRRAAISPGRNGEYAGLRPIPRAPGGRARRRQLTAPRMGTEHSARALPASPRGKIRRDAQRAAPTRGRGCSQMDGRLPLL